jgi:GNAT superfamily N-acetyltransferase
MHFEDYTPLFQEQVLALADRISGKGYFPNPSEIARGPNAYMVLCVSDDDELIGFAHGTVLDKNTLSDFLENRITDIPEPLRKADKEGTIGVIQTVGVLPEYRGAKIGSKLLAIVHDKLVGLGGDKLIATFKRGPGSTKIEGVMKRLGFKFWTRADSYWRDACDRGAFLCEQRTTQCNCQALFFQKAVF